MEGDRVNAVVGRLLCNIPAACEVLEAEGFHNLAGQLRRDCDALRYWQERGGLEWVRPAGSGAEWNLDVEGRVVE